MDTDTFTAHGVFLCTAYICEPVDGWVRAKQQASVGSALGCSMDTAQAEMLNQGPLCYR